MVWRSLFAQQQQQAISSENDVVAANPECRIPNSQIIVVANVKTLSQCCDSRVAEENGRTSHTSMIIPGGHFAPRRSSTVEYLPLSIPRVNCCSTQSRATEVPSRAQHYIDAANTSPGLGQHHRDTKWEAMTHGHRNNRP